MKPCAEIHEPEKTPTEQDKVEKLAGSGSPLVQLWPVLGHRPQGVLSSCFLSASPQVCSLTPRLLKQLLSPYLGQGPSSGGVLGARRRPWPSDGLNCRPYIFLLNANLTSSLLFLL